MAVGHPALAHVKTAMQASTLLSAQQNAKRVLQERRFQAQKIHAQTVRLAGFLVVTQARLVLEATRNTTTVVLHALHTLHTGLKAPAATQLATMHCTLTNGSRTATRMATSSYKLQTLWAW